MTTSAASNIYNILDNGDILSRAVAICPFGIAAVDSRGRLLYANSELERMFGYAEGEIIGELVDVLVPRNLRAAHAEHRVGFAAAPTKCVAKGRELSGRRKDGTHFAVEIGLNPISRSGVEMVVCAVIDITEQKRLQSLKDEFIATVRNELRTPLTSIAGALGLLVSGQGKALSVSGGNLLGIAYRNSQRVASVMENILLMDRIDSGKVVFVQRRVDLRTLVSNAVEAITPFADACDIHVKLAPAPAAIEMRTDTDWLTQAVTNVLSNAIKFSPQGGAVEVGVEARVDSVRISVRDQGTALPDDFMPYLFDSFSQADGSDSRQKGDLGLGLSVVKQIMTRLGGGVGVERVLAGGTLLYLELPLQNVVLRTDSEL